MSISPFDHPFLSGLIGDEEAARWFSAENDVIAMLSFESALAEAQAAEKIIENSAAEAIKLACKTFSPDVAVLRAAVALDGVVVPELIRQLREAIPHEHRAALHFGATSQDVIDTSLMIRLKPVLKHIDAGMSDILAKLDSLDNAFGDNGLTGYTRMQAAIEITVHDRIEAWRGPLLRNCQKLNVVKQDFPVIQFGGAAGTLDKLGDKGPAVRKRMADTLGLKDVPQWQNQRDIVAQFTDFLSQISGSLGKIGQDIALLAQGGNEISLSGGGKSSAMPHKQNPVWAELLVALARFNATQVSAMHHALIHEQERSGAAWTLEWMILPGMVTATVASVRTASSLLGSIMKIGLDITTKA